MLLDSGEFVSVCNEINIDDFRRFLPLNVCRPMDSQFYFSFTAFSFIGLFVRSLNHWMIWIKFLFHLMLSFVARHVLNIGLWFLFTLKMDVAFSQVQIWWPHESASVDRRYITLVSAFKQSHLIKSNRH